LLFTFLLFLRGAGQKPRVYELPPFGFLTRCLLRLSGHHPSDFDRLAPSITWQFAACGLSVLVPPIIAFFGVLLAARVFQIGGGLGLAIAFALFILMLDFILVAALGRSRGGHAGWVLAAYRALLALTIGWFIARPAILVVYGGAIDDLNRSNRWQQILRATEQREALKRNAIAAQQPLATHYAERRKQLEEQVKSVVSLKQQINAEIVTSEKAIKEEDLFGRDGRKPGRGEVWKGETEYLKENKDKLTKLQGEQARLMDELATLAASQEAQFDKAHDDPVFQGLGEAATKQITELKNHIPGWSEREDLLLQWVMQRPLKRLPGFLAIHGVLLLLDLLPLLTLLLVSRTELEKARQIRNAKLQAEAECAERVAREGAEETLLERLARDQFRERSATQKEISDLRLDFATHQILRQEQAEATVRPVFLKLRFKTTKPTPEQQLAWETAAEPLRQAVKKNLGDFDNLMR
jgi:Domain of unknown function (DUF4407)